MSLFSKLLGIVFVLMLIALILYVLFGQITVRKLRKNPATKDKLGIEFATGWDILNVAQALTIPISLNRKFRNSALSSFAADAEVLNKHTGRFDKLLARLLYTLFISSAFFGVLLLVLNFIGVID